jgi:cytochrome c biogenesis protein
MTASENPRTQNPVWRFFCSVRLTIVLLIILALVSIVGTLIPQQQGSMAFARNLRPGTLKIFLFFDLFDIYHAIWFRFLIGILALNLITCSINRFPGIWKRFSALPRPDRQRPFEGLPDELTIATPGQAEAVAKDVEHFFQKKYKRVRSKASGNIHYLYGERGRFAHFGFYLVHLSILIILVGAIVGSLFGFEAYVNIVEGGETAFVNRTKNMDRIPLGFTIRCDRFTVDFYENGTPKEYRSDLTFLADGKVLEKKSALVNHPAHFHGITFYQANYGTVVGDRARLKIIRKTSKPATTAVEVKKGESIQLPGGEGHFQVADIRENFMNMGPALLIRVHPDGGQEKSFWVFQDLPEIEKRFPGLTRKFSKLNPSAFKPYTFIIEKLDTRYYTGLQVAKDPGVALVWAGCFLMVGGFFITFFMSHRRIWVRVAPGEKHTLVSVAGSTSKNPVGLERELEHLSRSLEEHLTRKGRKVS